MGKTTKSKRAGAPAKSARQQKTNSRPQRPSTRVKPKAIGWARRVLTWKWVKMAGIVGFVVGALGVLANGTQVFSFFKGEKVDHSLLEFAPDTYDVGNHLESGIATVTVHLTLMNRSHTAARVRSIKSYAMDLRTHEGYWDNGISPAADPLERFHSDEFNAIFRVPAVALVANESPKHVLSYTLDKFAIFTKVEYSDDGDDGEVRTLLVSDTIQTGPQKLYSLTKSDYSQIEQSLPQELRRDDKPKHVALGHWFHSLF